MFFKYKSYLTKLSYRSFLSETCVTHNFPIPHPQWQNWPRCTAFPPKQPACLRVPWGEYTSFSKLGLQPSCSIPAPLLSSSLHLETLSLECYQIYNNSHRTGVFCAKHVFFSPKQDIRKSKITRAEPRAQQVINILKRLMTQIVVFEQNIVGRVRPLIMRSSDSFACFCSFLFSSV